MKILKSFILLCFIYSNSLSVFSQNLGLNARAKALGYVIIEDDWIRSFSIGAEILWKYRISIATDLVHLRWKHEEEVYPDGYDKPYFEYAQFDIRNYLASEARFYLINRDNPMDSSDISCFLSVLNKFGKRTIYHQDKFPFEEDDIYKQNGSLCTFGLMAGMQVGWFDFSLGLEARIENQDQQFYHKDGNFSYQYNINSLKWMPVIRVHFYKNIPIRRFFKVF